MCVGGSANGSSGPFSLGSKTEGFTLSSDRYSKEALKEANKTYNTFSLPEPAQDAVAGNELADNFKSAAVAASVTAADEYLNKYGARQGQTRISYNGQSNPTATGGGSKGGAMAGGTMLTGGGETLSTGARTAKKPTLLGQ